MDLILFFGKLRDYKILLPFLFIMYKIGMVGAMLLEAELCDYVIVVLLYIYIYIFRVVRCMYEAPSNGCGVSVYWKLPLDIFGVLLP